MTSFKEFELSGVLSFNGNRLTRDQFMDEFISMIEAKGWSYGGGWIALDDEGEPVVNEEEVLTIREQTPHTCQVCGNPAPDENRMCAKCLEEIMNDPFWTHGEQFTCFYCGKRTASGEQFGELICDQCLNTAKQIRVITPLPRDGESAALKLKLTLSMEEIGRQTREERGETIHD